MWIHGDGELPTLVRERTAGRGCELVLDPVGGELFDQSLRCLAVDGKILSVGFASGTVPSVKAGLLLIRNAGVEGVRLQPYRENYPFARRVHDELIGLLATGTITATIDRVLPGAELVAGLQR